MSRRLLAIALVSCLVGCGGESSEESRDGSSRAVANPSGNRELPTPGESSEESAGGSSGTETTRTDDTTEPVPPNPEPVDPDPEPAGDPVEVVKRPAEELKLLRAIAADEPGAELAYAEWLDERDPPRAKAVRFQHEQSQLDWKDERHRELRGELSELDGEHGDRWAEPVAVLVGDDGYASTRGGTVDSIECKGVTDEKLKCLAAVPAVRELWIGSGRIGKEGVALITSLRGLRRLSFEGEITFEEGALDGFDQLAPAADFGVYVDGIDRATINEIDDRRMRQFDDFTPEQQRRAARAFVAAHSYNSPRNGPIKVANFSQAGLRDAQMRFFTALPEVEEIYISESYVTSKGLAFLEGLENLRRLELFDTPVDSLVPITHHTSLEVLNVYPDYDTEMGDDGTVGLEKLVNLEVMFLNDDAISDATVKRLAPLVKLRELDLSVGELKDESSLAALAGLVELEKLSLSGAAFGDEGLSYIGKLRKLEVLNVRVSEGQGDGLGHLAGLEKLRYMSASGAAFTDTGIQHLAPLVGLRTMMAQGSKITPAGARKLADRLPGVTIVLDDHVVKSPRESYEFRRRLFGKLASILTPVDWEDDSRGGDSSDGDASSLWVTEDGWEQVGGWSGDKVGPCEIHLYVTDAKEGETPQQRVEKAVADKDYADAVLVEKDVVELRGADESASCVYRDTFGQHLLCYSQRGDRMVIFECEAPPSRFEEFRPLFLYVAQSVRISEDASQHPAETTTVAVKDLPSAKPTSSAQ